MNHPEKPTADLPNGQQRGVPQWPRRPIPPPRSIRVMRRFLWGLLLICVFFYVIGTEALKGKAVLGLLAAVLGLGLSYLVEWELRRFTRNDP